MTSTRIISRKLQMRHRNCGLENGVFHLRRRVNNSLSFPPAQAPATHSPRETEWGFNYVDQKTRQPQSICIFVSFCFDLFIFDPFFFLLSFVFSIAQQLVCSFHLFFYLTFFYYVTSTKIVRPLGRGNDAKPARTTPKNGMRY